MGFLETTAWRLFNSPQRDPFTEKSPKLLATPAQLSISKFSLHSGGPSSTSSSVSSSSPSSIFWMPPRTPSRWSPSRYIPSSIRNTVSKRQVAVLVCLTLALIVWVVPSPRSWQDRAIYITIPQQASSPYRVLHPASSTVKKDKADPLRWLEVNSNNRYATSASSRFPRTESPFTRVSSKPRAALISLVRNSELPGLMQSMRQLEYQWNRKYQYPWVFFNDEPFDDEFKV